MSDTERVLFVCSGNTCRSPMAAALALRLLDKSCQVETAGTAANDGAPAAPEAVQVMSEYGIDLRAHEARDLSRVNLGDFDRVVAMTPAIASELCGLGVEESKLVTLDIPDPFERGIEIYREAAARIHRDLRRLFLPRDGASVV